jgi:hypothetical protein
MISVVLSICSLGLAIFALGISGVSIVKSNINSNENFLRIVDHFEDKRIEIFQSLSKKDASPLIRNIWKMVTYTKRAVKLYEMENIEKDNLDVFFNQLEQLLFQSGIFWQGLNQTPPIQNFYLRKQDAIHVLSICKMFRGFKLDEKQRNTLETSYIDFISKIIEKAPDDKPIPPPSSGF